MEGIVLAANGPVGERCAKVLDDLGIKYDRWPEKKSGTLLVSVHWRKIFMPSQLAQFSMGGLNVHNSYLPWNRGADACSWAIAENTPHGATVHWMTLQLDCGGILEIEPVEVYADETADQLYKRTADAEVVAFRRAIENLVDAGVPYDRPHLKKAGGSYHSKADFQRLVRAVSTRDYQVVKREV